MPIPITLTLLLTTLTRCDNMNKLEKLFKDFGYTTKKAPVIGGWKPDLFAIGTGEILCIGAIDADPEKLRKYVHSVESLVTETLDSDVNINVGLVIVNAKSDKYADKIYSVKTLDDLKRHLAKSAKPKTVSDKNDFNAYSKYMDAVIEYFGKVKV